MEEELASHRTTASRLAWIATAISPISTLTDIEFLQRFEKLLTFFFLP